MGSFSFFQAAPRGSTGFVRVGARALGGLAPGVVLCGALAAAAFVLETAERHVFGEAWLEALVLAILLGALVRVLWTPGPRWGAGVDVSAKTFLELAIVLLGGSVDVANLISVGPALVAGIAGVVTLTIATGYGLGRLFGLSRRMSALVASGNAICGNSAIAAIAPLIAAEGEDVTAAIGFTAVAGVVVVLALPALAATVRLTPLEGGVLAGMTVYAVPQVFAAAAPLGVAAAQIGMLVKLVRVAMLGPVCGAFSMLASRLKDANRTPGPRVADAERRVAGRGARPPLIPWFMIGFFLMVAARSSGALSGAFTHATSQAVMGLTVVAMAALGLNTDVRILVRAGGRVTGTVTISLIVLNLLSLALIHELPLR